MQSSKMFTVKGKQHPYEENDPIFFRREPCTDRKKQAMCLSCDFDFDEIKQMNFCEFCGYAQCKNCL